MLMSTIGELAAASSDSVVSLLWRIMRRNSEQDNDDSTSSTPSQPHLMARQDMVGRRGLFEQL